MDSVNISREESTPCDVAAEMKQLQELFFGADFFANDSSFPSKEHRQSLDSIKSSFNHLNAFFCIFGVLGNIMNILVLSQKGMIVSMERMEKAAHSSLLALAFSDLIFCFLMLLHLWIPVSEEYLYRSFVLYFDTYSEGLINTFLLSSTWLTVTMATSRYLAICYPLHARRFIGMTFARVSISLVFIICILLNIPKFFTWQIKEDNTFCAPIYLKEEGTMLNGQAFARFYRWAYFVWGVFIPFLALAFCNVNLIRALRRSFRIRSSLRAGHTPNKVTLSNRITLIFIIIIILYLLTVIPGELAHFVRHSVSKSGEQSTFSKFNVFLTVSNALQTLNFSSNFVLYSALNTNFRRQMCMLIHCQRWRRYSYSTTTSTRQVELSNSEHALTTSIIQHNKAYV